MIKGTIKVGDIIVIDKIDQVIEIVGCLPEEGKLHYWTDEDPKQVGTKKCKVMDAWIAFRLGTRLTNVGNWVKEGRKSPVV